MLGYEWCTVQSRGAGEQGSENLYVNALVSTHKEYSAMSCAAELPKTLQANMC